MPNLQKILKEIEKEFDLTFWDKKDGYYIELKENEELREDIKSFLRSSIEKAVRECLEKVRKIDFRDLKIDPLREQREGTRGHIINLVKEDLEAKIKQIFIAKIVEEYKKEKKEK